MITSLPSSQSRKLVTAECHVTNNQRTRVTRDGVTQLPPLPAAAAAQAPKAKVPSAA